MIAPTPSAIHLGTLAEARVAIVLTTLSIHTSRLFTLCSLAALIASCGLLNADSEVIELTLPSGDELLFPRQVEPDLRPGEVDGTALALLPGNLRIVGDCLVAEDPHYGTIYTPIWPPEYRADVVSTALVQVRDSEGLLVGGLGDDIVLFGAVTESLDGYDRIIPSLVRQEVERRCPPNYWIVGGVSERAEPDS